MEKPKKNPAAVALGRIGGKAIAERGPDYFRELQAKRKARKGGRPPKEENTLYKSVLDSAKDAV
jgi:hypothetical protein